jgi:hypothetical protein
MRKLVLLFVVLALACLAVTGCGSSSDNTPNHAAQNKANDNHNAFQPYIPGTPNTEQTNYNKAQELYNDPSTIIWCTAFPSSPAAPFVTVPIAGKLTSSTTSAFSGIHNIDRGNYSWQQEPFPSVDGLYHPNPPPYRYGFTPGGQYVDFFNLQTLCTTQPLKFQRQNLAITPDAALTHADAQAQDALKNGNKAEAQRILEAAAGGQ